MQKIVCDILYPDTDDDFCSYSVEWNSELGNREAEVGENLITRVMEIAKASHVLLKAYRDSLNAAEL